MTPERWQQIRDVLEKALELAPEERSGFLAQACSSDQSLRQEVDTLLVSSDDMQSLFLQSSPLRVTLASGTKLGEYEIKSLVGAGGMGEVYRAHDSRLGRDVAIKVLPSFFSADSERLRRFEQEARAAAALNHPNILAVFQMGTYEGAPYLVSELLEGETLREQIKRGSISVGKAIDYGVQITRGLAAAHEKGIVHRDLKPENLFITSNGRLKILDFGLAKLTKARPPSQFVAANTKEGTEPGMVMGTVGYMSPEQVRGQAIDHRSDIFAFGAVLYEMLAGKRAFEKLTPADAMSAILHEEPPGISHITPKVPAALKRVLRRCLEKNPEQRFQSASDLAFTLASLAASGGSSRSAMDAMDANDATGPARRWKLMVPIAVVIAVVIAAISVGGYFSLHRASKLTDKDTIVLSDFANTTGDAVFDDTLKTALSVSLRESPFLNLLSDSKVVKILREMARPAGTKLTPDVARELCLRAGSKAYIAGAIGSLASEYVLELKAVNCENGDRLAEQQTTVASKEQVLDALAKAASSLRAGLGESLATVARFDVPPYRATTSSIEALQAFSLGRKAVDEKGIAAALPYDQRAVELDPNFALGYLALGNDYNNLGETGRSGKYYKRAFQLREHAGEKERVQITANYYRTVTGELEKAAESYEELIESYPRVGGAYDNLGLLYAGQGLYEKAAQTTRQGMHVAPPSPAGYADLANYTLALQRFDEARQVVHDAQARKLDSFVMHNALYILAFLESDSSAMAEQQQWFTGKPEETFGLALASDTEAYRGHLAKARELTKRAVDSAIRADGKESGAIWQAIAGQREAAFGDRAKARQSASEAVKLVPASQAVESEAALAFALAGDRRRAEPLARDLNEHSPLDTQIQALWLPAIHAQLALDQNNPALALTTLQSASPLEFGQIQFVNNLSCLYTVYVRGEAYLATGQSTAAAAEFQKILDHSGIVSNCWTGALAYLGVARANALQARTSGGAVADAAAGRALVAYKHFLTLWKDADSNVPLFKQAKAEYAKLQ
jgi:tetratricopeptide (TPR) repeat protein